MSKRILALRIALVIILVFCFFAFAAGIIADQASRESEMRLKIIKYADTSASGVAQDEYHKLASAITGYLDGNLDTAQVAVIKGDRILPAFTEDELLHLQDIQGLLRLAETLKYIAWALLISSLVFGMFIIFSGKKKPALAGLRNLRLVINWSVSIALGLFLAVAIWGFFNFEGLFYAFHKLLFRNDLWLLDPQTDLLLQLMPLELFISYGLDMIKQNILFIILLPVLMLVLNIRKRQDHGIL